MKIQLSKVQWEHIGRTAGWFKNPVRATLVMDYSGDQTVSVLTRGSKEPYFVIDGVPDFDLLDKEKINRYLNETDWTDRGSPGWITPRINAKEFLKDEDLKDPYKKMRSIRVTFSDGYHFETQINGTKKEILEYYMPEGKPGSPHDFSNAHPEKTRQVVNVEFLD